MDPGDVWSREMDGPDRNGIDSGGETHTSGTRGPSKYITANRPDIVLVDRSVRRAIIVDITIPHDDNLVKAEKEKVSKYLDLAHEITAMWNVESTVVVPIVVSVNGLLAKSFDQHLKKLSLGCWIKGRIQKA
ncbi:jg26439 [Pararge aegeria aegeria]|uniref:Jg26439 protein n=1 Tax=Pararge aegeria aegeria TaxID=348720 RepID=A0A8S4QQW9_9NEOP|nr:jg26439 [Pararge aegeria aegeria]